MQRIGNIWEMGGNNPILYLTFTVSFTSSHPFLHWELAKEEGKNLAVGLKNYFNPIVR